MPAVDETLPQLPSATLPLDATDLFYIVQQVTSTSSTSNKISFVDLSAQIGGGTGDVVGPASATPGNLAVFDGGTGKLIKDGGAPGGGFDPLKEATFYDDFLNGPLTSTISTGITPWGTNASIDNAQPVLIAGHPGIIRLLGASGGNGAMFLPGAGSTPNFCLPAEMFDLTWCVNCSRTGMVFRAGLTVLPTSITPTDAIFLETLAGDTNWFGVTWAGSSQTRVDTTVAKGLDTWLRLHVYRKNGTTIGFQVNGSTEVTITTNIPTNSLYLFAQAEGSGGSSALFFLDFVNFIITGLSR